MKGCDCMGGRGASSFQARYNRYVKNYPTFYQQWLEHVDKKGPSDIKVNDSIVTRETVDNGKNFYTGTNETKYITWNSEYGRFEPMDDVKVTNIKRGPKQTKITGLTPKGTVVTKTYKNNQPIYTRKPK